MTRLANIPHPMILSNPRYLLAALFLLHGAGAASAQTYWEYAGETYNPGPLSCSPESGKYLNWAKKIADADGPLDVGGLAVPDGEVQFEDLRNGNLTVLNWSRPYYDRNTDTIRLYLSVTDTRGQTSMRVGAKGGWEGGALGGATQAGAWDGASRVAEYALRPGTYRKTDDFNVTIYISDGGSCTERVVARYYFRATNMPPPAPTPAMRAPSGPAGSRSGISAVEVVFPSVNVFRGPSVDSTLLGTLEGGQKVDLEEIITDGNGDGWIRICGDGWCGWAAQEFFSPLE